jgi:16S rRNA (cytosine1402-N4)-methyltransferase
MSQTPHIPVLLSAVLESLLPEGRMMERIIDGTLGAGGHTRALLEAGAREVLGMDRDPVALAIAAENLAGFEGRAHIVHGSYATMGEQCRALGWAGVDAILLDLGVSSMQLDTPDRGFAFAKDGPLDMRFDPAGERPSAAELVNNLDAAELADLFYKYGEERHGRLLATAIVRARPFERTGELARVIEAAMPRPRGKQKRETKSIHPATRIFQALRIAANDELGELERALPVAIDLLEPGGRLAVISFHSLEDRIVKQTFRKAAEEIVSPPGMQLEEKAAVVRALTRKPVVADAAEIADNPRSRSAKLRVVGKL